MRPWLVMVTGESGAGKTTLGLALAAELRLPFVSRDAVRAGLLATEGLWRGEISDASQREAAVESFVKILEATASTGVTAVAEFVVMDSREAAWRRLQAAANCAVIVVEARDARQRAEARDRVDPLLNRAGVLETLGYSSIDDYFAAQDGDVVRATMRTEFDVPTLRVCTDDGYDPTIPSIVEWLVDQTRRSL